MEVEDSLEVPNLKAGSRSNSRELLDRESNETSETETSGDTSDKGVISNDKDLPNGAEHDGSSKEDKAEEEAGDGNDILAGQENPPVEDTSRGDSPREEDSSKKEDSCDKVVEEESHSNVARSDVAMESENSTGSENWRLNIDTSGTTTPSGQGVSEGEDLAEESKANGKESPTEQDDLSSDEAFPGFEDIPTCLPDGHSILKNIIEKLERNEFLSANSNKEENLSDSVEFTVTNNEASSSSKKISLSVNFDDSKIDMSTVKSSNQHLPSARLIKESKNQSTESSSFIHSSMDTSPKVDTVNTAEMMGSEEVTSSTTSSPSLGSGHSGRGKKIHVDVSNPAFRKPMELGWKRELVYRNTSDVGMKRMADIYYYTPLGKKVRSNREVVENLIGDELTLENFTFFKEPLGINDPTKEIIRDAKRVAQKEAVGTPPKKIPKLASQKATTKEGQLSSKPIVVLFKDPNISSIGTGTRETTPPTAGSSSKPKPMTRAFPRIKVTPLRSQRPSMMGTPTSSKPTSGSKLKRDVDDSGELEMGMLHPMWRDPSNLLIHKKAALTSPQLSTPSPGAKGTPSSSSKNFSLSILKSSTAKSAKKVQSPCSIQCLGMMGIIPSLHCRLCLCLYHPECVGLGPITDTIHSYVCKKCQQAIKDGKTTIISSSKLLEGTVSSKMSSTTPPPLTPISALGASNGNIKTTTASDQGSGTVSTVTTIATVSSPPKLQRLPRPIELLNSKLQRMPRPGEQPVKLQTVPRFVKVTCTDARPNGNNNLITAVTPATSTITKTVINNKNTIVGSVTSWLPSSSTIQLHSSPTVPYKTAENATGTKILAAVVSPTTITEADPDSDDPSAQSLIRMSGRRYVVVQKSNILSVSPAAAATATTPTARVSIGLGDPTQFGDKAPPLVSGGIVIASITPSTSTNIGQPRAASGAPTTSSAQTVSFVQPSTGGPILPKPTTTFLMGGSSSTPGLLNPPGVILVPVLQNSPIVSAAEGGGGTGAQQQPQYMLVNATGGGFIFSNVPSVQQSAKKSIASTTESKENSSSVEEVRSSKLQTDDHFMQFFMQNLGAGYMALIEVFKYLKVQELLRAGRVCRMWHDLTGQALLWKTVRMKNSQVVDWKGCADSLRRYGTEELDLRKMLVTGQSNEMWEEFCVAMGTIPTLRRLELCKCPASVIERLTQECSQLQSITALALRCPNISLRFMNNLKNLKELRLKSIQGIDLNSKLDVLQNLTNLKHLSLTTFTELGRMGPSVIGTLTSLESLELGDFCDFPESFGSTLLHLNKLQRLRLEKGQGKLCPTFKVLAGVQELPCLTQLELVNFDIKAGFDQALAQCTNLRRLLIIPTYVTQSATTNHMVLGGVTKLGASLVDFVWGVTHELLRVTELFVDQCDAQKGARLTPKSSKKNGTGESIPVLRPVPGLIEDPLSDAGSDKSAGSKHNLGKDENGGEGIKPSAAAQQQVDILPLSKLQTLLNTALPNAKVKILRIPFQSTWRQSIGEHSH